MRYGSPSNSNYSYSFGPGPLTPVIKAIVYANIAMFLVSAVAPAIIPIFGLRPVEVVTELRFWQPVTYMFLHGGVFHILFNMLILWMFGTELERTWRSEYFAKYYFVSGVGAAVTTIVLSFTPFFGDGVYFSLTIGASGAVYGVLLAFALYFPHRPILLFFFFPVPAKYAVMIMGGISLYSAVGSGGGGVAHTTHLGGLLAGYLYLKGGRLQVSSEIKYRYLKWKLDRTRRRFDVYTGGRKDDVNRRIH